MLQCYPGRWWPPLWSSRFKLFLNSENYLALVDFDQKFWTWDHWATALVQWKAHKYLTAATQVTGTSLWWNCLIWKNLEVPTAKSWSRAAVDIKYQSALPLQLGLRLRKFLDKTDIASPTEAAKLSQRLILVHPLPQITLENGRLCISGRRCK